MWIDICVGGHWWQRELVDNVRALRSLRVKPPQSRFARQLPQRGSQTLRSLRSLREFLPRRGSAWRGALHGRGWGPKPGGIRHRCIGFLPGRNSARRCGEMLEGRQPSSLRGSRGFRPEKDGPDPFRREDGNRRAGERPRTIRKHCRSCRGSPRRSAPSFRRGGYLRPSPIRGGADRHWLERDSSNSSRNTTRCHRVRAGRTAQHSGATARSEARRFRRRGRRAPIPLRSADGIRIRPEPGPRRVPARRSGGRIPPPPSTKPTRQESPVREVRRTKRDRRPSEAPMPPGRFAPRSGHRQQGTSAPGRRPFRRPSPLPMPLARPPFRRARSLAKG